jgi:hypothetical protein
MTMPNEPRPVAATLPMAASSVIPPIDARADDAVAMRPDSEAAPDAAPRTLAAVAERPNTAVNAVVALFAVADADARADRVARQVAADFAAAELRVLPASPVTGAIAARPNTAEATRPDAETM